MGCSLVNLGECLPESFVNFFLDIFNAPLEPMLSLVQKLFTEPVNVSGFKSLWLVIVSVIGMFYGLAFLYAGFNFIMAGFDVSRKETAKTWLKNILMMMVAVQSSFWLYQLIIEIGALMTAGVFSLIPPDFFRLTADIFPEIGLSLMMTITYAVVLLFTALLLVLRYIIVVAGVLFFPIGLFLYFLPPLRSLGKLMLSLCGVAIFMTFFASIMLLIASKLLTLDIFILNKLMLMIAAFILVDFTLIGMWVFSTLKSAMSLMDINFSQSVTSSLKMMI